jgi:DNA (cytosine-5)-methyltransferase 1
MIYGSVCSGIEAASVAWQPLGWQAAFVSEIEAFPRAVLAERFPETPLHGDFTTIGAGDYRAIDLLVGGTPCQDFSIAGRGAGLDGDRGNLTLEYLRLARRLRPKWVVWENVPGVLSHDDGRTFGAILGGLAELGYGWAYRVLDAQHFGVPQRRRRVFVVGYLGDWRPAGAVLFERASLRRDSAPRRAAPEDTAGTLAGGARLDGGYSTDDIPLIAGALSANDGGADENDAEQSRLVPALTTRPYADQVGAGGGLVPAVADTLNANGKAAGSATQQDAESGMLVAYGGNRSSGPIDVATAVNAHGGPHGRLDLETETFITFDIMQVTSPQNGSRMRPGDPAPTLSARARPTHHVAPVGFNSREDPCVYGDASGALGSSSPQAQAVAFDLRGRDGGAQLEGPHDTAAIRAASGGASRSFIARSGVRRLTPLECERLQGLPDGYTAITYRRKPAADGPRYKAIGNGMAKPVMEWIGRRIDAVEEILRQEGRRCRSV